MFVSLTGCTGETDPFLESYFNESDPNSVHKNVFDRAMIYIPPYDDPTEDGLPLTGNMGSVSLKESFAEDSERYRPLLEEFVGQSDFEKRIETAQKILSILCGTGNISETEGTFSECKLTVLRKVWSKDPETAVREVPEPQNEPEIAKAIQSNYLNMAYNTLIIRYCLSLICSLGYNNISYIRKYTDSSGNEYPYMGYFNRHLCYGLELGEMSEREFCDSIAAMAAFEVMKSNDLRMTAEFYAYVEQQALFAYNDEASEKRCLKLTREMLSNTVASICNVMEPYVIVRSESDDILEGTVDSSWLLIGGEGNDTLVGNNSDDFFIGGEGDDVYVIKPGCGCDTIYDCEGRNEIKFIDVTSVYAVGFSEDDLKDDVKLCFGNEYVIIKNFLANRSVLFDIEINGGRIAYDSPENPLSDIHEPGYVPNITAPPR